ncbi:hypothetical protein ECZU21_38840 [Escherichia coli]|nr:hypothetical protein ECZU21_38840 [Escherichia coli]
MHDPAYPESLPAAPLVRYTYTEAGELLAVYDRSNTQVRAFTYDAQHRAGWWRTVTREGRRCATATTIRGGWWSN